MVLVIDYWKSMDLRWLDGAACSAPETCSGNHAEVSDMKLITNSKETSAFCPISIGCSCDNIDYNQDDGSECWCRCACAKTSLVPRCVWSGYQPFWEIW
mmetsp:Transcript_12402/g.15070  ORF Transcript_12402/g.15070 Transcript_12402/m.15070 type:complete len:99 (+) Transcript_12402:1-297(+)